MNTRELLQFTIDTPVRWAKELARKTEAPVYGLALNLIREAHCPSLALYPMLSSTDSRLPWQVRLDGLAVGKIGHGSGFLRLNERSLDKPGEPRDTWRRVMGRKEFIFDRSSLSEAVTLIRRLVDEWQGERYPNVLLDHGQREHALEAHVLSGRIQLSTGADALSPIMDVHDGVLRTAQFPTLWEDAVGPPRYLDALLADSEGRPWAIELKFQAPNAHPGAYLRHGIAQAVLYRHFVRNAPALDGWFSACGLRREECQAAVAFPSSFSTDVDASGALRRLAARASVEVIEFARPGM